MANEYDDERNLRASVVYAKALDRCTQLGLPCFSYSSFLLFLKKRDQNASIACRQGRKAAAAAAPALSLRDPAVHGQGPMDIVHIDHTELDVLVRVGSGRDAVTERLWLTIAICAWSRRIVGYDLSFDAPAVAGLFTAVRDVFDRQSRMPNRLIVDRGPEFGSTAFEELCAACEIDGAQRPPGKPKFGSVVEAMFGVTNKQFVHVLRGNTQLLKNPRGMSREVAPTQAAVWRLPELDTAVQRFLFEVYPRLPHEGLDGMTPDARFEQGLAAIGSGRRLPTSADIRFLLWPPYRRGTAMVNSRTGIVVEYIHYWHADMRSLHKARVPVRVDPHDVTHVVTFLNGRWVLCRAERSADLAGYSRRELRLASMEVRRRNRGSGKRRMIRVHEIVPMLRELAATEAGLVRVHQEEERRAVLAERNLSLVPDSASRTEDHPESGAPGWEILDLDDIGAGTRL